LEENIARGRQSFKRGATLAFRTDSVH
jgi:hypothetical protein